MRHIHLNCLRLWINQRVEIKFHLNSTTITWKSLNCELCKTPYPFAVYFNERIYELINYQLPALPYAIFECYAKDCIDSNGLCIITFSSKKIIKIGRHADNELRISDVSVSRHHAVLQLDGSSLYIMDCNSKFGTLLMMKQPFMIGSRTELEVQSGKYLFGFNLEIGWSLFSCFTRPVIEKVHTEETKIFQEECLPGEGKHSVLVVNINEYNKFLKSDFKIRRNKTTI